jgi:hypothetical protein
LKSCFPFAFLIFIYTINGCREGTVNEPINESRQIVQISEAGEFTAPSGDDIWIRGSTYVIKWKDFAPDYNVDLVLLKKKKYYPVEILINAPNLGSFTWNVPPEIIPSSYYQLKLVNSASPDHFIYSSPFVIK